MNVNRRPLFDLYLNLWLFRIHTALWRDSFNEDAIDYVMLFFDVRTFHKRPTPWPDPWLEVFKFRIYQTGLRLLEAKKVS